MSSKPQCHYVKPSGVLCGSPAMRGHLHCYFHHQAELRARRRVRLGGPHSTGLDFGTLEDGATIQTAIADVMHHLVDRIIDRATAATLLYGLQLAMNNHLNLQTKAYSHEEYVGNLPDPEDQFDRIDTDSRTKSSKASSQPAARTEKPASSELSSTTTKPGSKVSNSAICQSDNSSIKLSRPMTVVTELTPTIPPAPKKTPKRESFPLTRPEDVTDPELRLKIFGIPEDAPARNHKSGDRARFCPVTPSKS